MLLYREVSCVRITLALFSVQEVESPKKQKQSRPVQCFQALLYEDERPWSVGERAAILVVMEIALAILLHGVLDRQSLVDERSNLQRKYSSLLL